MAIYRPLYSFSLLLLWLGRLLAADSPLLWHQTELQYLHGDGYRQPFNSKDVSQSIITFTHAHGWSFGHNFMFMDTLISEAGQPAQTGVYGEAYSYFSVGKLLDMDLSLGIVKDLNAAVGVNAGENFNSRQSGTRVALYGVSVDFTLPAFKLFSIDFLRHNVFEPTASGSSWQITPVWILPFEIAGSQWSLEGFADFIGSKGSDTAETILAQPQLRLDVGDLWDESKHLYVGIEYQYWYNKYGIKGLQDNVPQALLMWKF
jgi:nucleoside-specific outer membrane channel protein Tsx